jgi:hypothetical protein
LFAQVPLQLGFSPLHSTRHGASLHVNAHRAPTPQRQRPSAQVPLQDGFAPSHSTLHGVTLHAKAHVASVSQRQTPFAQVALHDEPPAHVTWQGSFEHVSSHLAAAAQVHDAFVQSRRSHRSAAVQTVGSGPGVGPGPASAPGVPPSRPGCAVVPGAGLVPPSGDAAAPPAKGPVTSKSFAPLQAVIANASTRPWIRVTRTGCETGRGSARPLTGTSTAERRSGRRRRRCRRCR